MRRPEGSPRCGGQMSAAMSRGDCLVVKLENMRPRFGAALLAATSLAAPLANPAFAQQTQGPAETTDENRDRVIVTGSRIERSGFEAPTPTTVLGSDDIEKIAAPNIADVVNLIPAARPSMTPATSTNSPAYAGGNYLDLRGLGWSRTLVLVDGKRFVSSNVQGPVDINNIPQALIGSVDIVTGGASAAWGSDAVAGVVNFGLNHDLEGFKGTIQGGMTDHRDHQNVMVSLGYGGSFADDKGKLLLAVEGADNSGIPFLFNRDWGRASWDVIPNPAFTTTNSEPRNLLVPDRRYPDYTLGGVINAGPLAGLQFAPDGNLIPMVYGSLRTATGMMGGSGANRSEFLILEAPTSRYSAYGRLSYDLTDALTVFGEASYGETETEYTSLVQRNTVTIRNDNAFLKPSVRTAMATAGVTSFSMNRYSPDFAYVPNSLKAETTRYVAGVEGRLGGSWEWDAYYTNGRTDRRQDNPEAVVAANLTNAVDAIIDPVTGAAVCRTAAARAQGCVPINLMGAGAPSREAIDYVTRETWNTWDLRQEAAALTLKGEPFSIWAGPISMAAGFEWRQESADVSSDPLSAGGQLASGGATPWSAEVSVKEAFGEVVVPLARDQAWAESLDLNLAARVTDYSTSGTVETWKVGGTWDINSDVRLRATRSRDIRAPSLFDLYTASSRALDTTLDPVLNLNYVFNTVTRGNARLEPEEADTLTAGVVYTPSFASGLRVSVDLYDIDLNGAIISITAPSIIDRCYRDQPELCRLITRGADGRISEVERSPQNLQKLNTTGVDTEIAYDMLLGSGELSLRGLFTYIDDLTIDDGRVVTELAGSTGQPNIQDFGGQPHWRANANATYTQGPARFSLTGRFVGGGNVDNKFTTKDLNVLETSGRLYVDASVQYDLIDDGDRRLSAFAAVSNLLDKDPPIIGTVGFVTSRSLYDVIGRNFTVGIRFEN